MADEMRKFCVVFGQRTKCIITRAPFDIQTIKEKLAEKFATQGPFSLQVKDKSFGIYVDIDENNDDDQQIFDEAREIKIIQNVIPVPEQLDLSPNELTAQQAQQVREEAHVVPGPSHTGRAVASDQSFDVKSIILQHPRGQIIEDEYTKNGTITSETRRLLTSIVVAEMVKRFSFYPSRDEKILTAKAITDAYPLLGNPRASFPYEAYFNPKESHNIGHIMSRLANLRRSLKDDEKARPRRKGDKSPNPLDKTKQLKRQRLDGKTLTDTEETELILLCNRSDHLENALTIKQSMSDTFLNRQNWITADSPSVTDIFKKYGRFRDIPELIDQDFNRLYSREVGMSLLTTWETRYVPSILKIAKMSHVKKVVELCDELCSNGPEPSTETQSFYAFNLLIALVPSQSKKKMSTADSFHFFMDFKPMGTNIQHYLDDKENRENRRQPYILCLGTRRSRSQYFIIADCEAIPCQSDITVAVDKLFKVHYIFNLQYAAQLHAFFIFLENVYNIPNQERAPTRVQELLTKIYVANI